MSIARWVVGLAMAGAILGGCARPPEARPLSEPMVTPAASFVAETSSVSTVSALRATSRALVQWPARIFGTGQLAGRTLAVASAAEIVLMPREVILTFDDGPRPGKTEMILDTLDDFGVKATFLMLGQSALRYPHAAQLVALRGHTVGTHTFDHRDLSMVTRQEALDEIAAGQRAVARVLAMVKLAPSPFFRFPYLADTGFLRANLLQGSVTVLDVDIDSKDYYRETPDMVIARTLARLEAKGSGVILFHDIHTRTVAMLPQFLQAIEARGYSVVHLVAREPGVFGKELVVAEALGAQ